VFKLDQNGNETVLHTFSGADGAHPYAGLITDAAGNFYGTTDSGGDLNCNAPYGCGTVFKLGKNGDETVLHNFGGAGDGGNPTASVIGDAAGNLYGTTYLGGASGYGAVFKLDKNGNETLLHSFSGADGDYPSAGLFRDTAGNLYGTTYGVEYLGTVFELIPSTPRRRERE
jgi:uncharacterized repeat protein (TIGR03803 family)